MPKLRQNQLQNMFKIRCVKNSSYTGFSLVEKGARFPLSTCGAFMVRVPCLGRERRETRSPIWSLLLCCSQRGDRRECQAPDLANSSAFKSLWIQHVMMSGNPKKANGYTFSGCWTVRLLYIENKGICVIHPSDKRKWCFGVWANNCGTYVFFRYNGRLRW